MIIIVTATDYGKSNNSLIIKKTWSTRGRRFYSDVRVKCTWISRYYYPIYFEPYICMRVTVFVKIVIFIQIFCSAHFVYAKLDW